MRHPCLGRLADGEWVKQQHQHQHHWQWSAAAEHCGIKAFDSAAAIIGARERLCGAHITFVGNSMQRRAMYALADLLGGNNATRRGRRHDGPDAGDLAFDASLMADAKARNTSNAIMDYAEGNHAFQFVSVACDSGRATRPILADAYCGTPGSHLETDDADPKMRRCHSQRQQCRTGFIPCSVPEPPQVARTISLSFTFLGKIGIDYRGHSLRDLILAWGATSASLLPHVGAAAADTIESSPVQSSPVKRPHAAAAADIVVIVPTDHAKPRAL